MSLCFHMTLSCILLQEDVAAGKETNWPELEVVGSIRNLSPALWKLTHLTALYLDNNHLTRLPPNISLLRNLRNVNLFFRLKAPLTSFRNLCM